MNKWMESNFTVYLKLLFELIPQHSPQQLIRSCSGELSKDLHKADLLNSKSQIPTLVRLS